MSDDSKKLANVISINEAEVKDHLGEIVRSTVEETLNGLLDAEADELCQAKRYERSAERVDTRAGSYQRGLETKAGRVSLNVKRRDILRVDRRVLLRVGADAVISIDGHDIRATTGGITSKKYIHIIQKVASYPLLFSQTRRKNGCHNRGFRLMMLILS